ncbi:hypothetical protein BaRGS_00017958 [Batillaria attramentaria]|uniref:Uncharacterized protein n=1 Tax=Batillaria attramentaria TaxID=370345 RepID=A0ABD0KU45_9CAEN
MQPTLKSCGYNVIGPHHATPHTVLTAFRYSRCRVPISTFAGRVALTVGYLSGAVGIGFTRSSDIAITNWKRRQKKASEWVISEYEFCF